MIRADRLITDCRLATMAEGGAAYGAVEDGALLVRDGRIVWAGARDDLPAHEAATIDRPVRRAASSTPLIASSRVSPAEKHPGRSGTTTPKA
jgi:hypothetical protein